MSLFEKLVYGTGWCPVKADRSALLDKIGASFVAAANDCFGSNLQSVNELREHLCLLDNPAVNDLKMRLINIENLSFLLQSAFSDTTRELCGRTIFLQRRSHVMFNIPGKIHTATMHHIDAMSGISPFSYILWAPLHAIDDDSGVYLVDQEPSMQLMQDEHERGRVMSDTTLDLNSRPIQLNYGEGVVFNPFVLHGSVTYNGTLARIAVTNRFQSRSKPLFLRNSEFFYSSQIGSI